MPDDVPSVVEFQGLSSQTRCYDFAKECSRLGVRHLTLESLVQEQNIRERRQLLQTRAQHLCISGRIRTSDLISTPIAIALYAIPIQTTSPLCLYFGARCCRPDKQFPRIRGSWENSIHPTHAGTAA
jgi:hypothetical protein